jgi:hypothetical protein
MTYRAMKPAPAPVVTYAKPKNPPRPAPPKQRITTEEDGPPVVKPAQSAAAAPKEQRALLPSIVKDANGEALLPHAILFGEGWVITRLHKRLNHHAAKFGMRFYRVPFPGVGWCYWFMVPNDGTPLDPTLEPRLTAALIERNIYLPRGRLLPGQLPKETK